MTRIDTQAADVSESPSAMAQNSRCKVFFQGQTQSDRFRGVAIGLISGHLIWDTPVGHPDHPLIFAYASLGKGASIVYCYK